MPPICAFIALACAVGCASPPPAPAPAPKPVTTRAPTQRARPPRWPRFDEAKSWDAINPEPFPSRGHGAGAYAIEVRVSPDARERYAALLPGTTLPEGAVVTAFHQHVDTGKPGPIYVMEKRTSAWSFQALDADGRPVEHAVELCQRCHAEAPADSLFGLPKERRKPPEK